MTPKLSFPARGLYAITQTDNRTLDDIVADVEAVLRGGALVVQYRDKNPHDAEALARRLAVLCHNYNVPLLINDNAELAAKVGADGVHLGKDDGGIEQARALLGPHAIIGISCYNSLERALLAQSQGASYVAFGRFFPSHSKPLAAPAQLETLRQAKAVINLPIVAIGGILPDNGATLLTAGADVLAVIGGLFDNSLPTQCPEQSALAFKPLFL